MLIKGSFIDITNTNKYYIEIGTLQTGETPIIIKNADEYNHDDTESIFFGAEPVMINSDLSDSFTHVYIRSCSITLTCNFDIRNKGIVAKNYTDIKVVIKRNNDQGDIIFSGFVSPLTFNQTYGYNYNEFTLECVDKLGVLEYIKVPDVKNTISAFDYGSYNKPRYFINTMLSLCGFTYNANPADSTIHYDIEYDHTNDTMINPAIFVGDSEDDWMTCKDALEEIGKLYGCYFYQNGDDCYIENILLYDISSTQSVNVDEYTSADTNISVDQAYNKIKCTVDISSMDETFLDPFDDENISLIGKYSERVLTELLYKNKDNKFENLYNTRELYKYAYGDPYLPGATPIKNWSKVQSTVVENENCEVYDNYAQVIKNKMFDFHSTEHTDIVGDPTYLDFTTWDDSDEGIHSEWTRATNTLKWLWEHPGRGAFIAFGKTNNLTNWKNKERPQLKDMKNYLLIQLNWNRSDSDYGGSETNETQRRQAIYNRIGDILDAASPVCSMTMAESKNLVPSDSGTINYLIFSGKIRLNPIVARTGPAGDFDYDNNKVYNFWRRGTVNTVETALQRWNAVWNKAALWWSIAPSNVMKGNTVKKDDDDGTYYNSYGWINRKGGFDQQSGIIYGTWPYNAKNPSFNAKLAYPYLSPNYETWKYEQSRYERDGDPVPVDAVEKLAVLACELKIGNKYLIEDLNKLDQQTWSMGEELYNSTYKWVDENDLPEVDGVPQTWFTIGINPGIGDNIVGKDFDIQNTVEIFMNLDAKGLAIPIRYSDNLSGPVTFRILGPYNMLYQNKVMKYCWWPFGRRAAVTLTDEVPLLAYLENILISDFKIELKSVNVNGTSQNNTDNDLVYTSLAESIYTDDQEYSSKFCTALSSEEVADLEVDYNLNNSAIVDEQNNPWMGMQSYEGQYAPDNKHLIKLEECRVSEQYNLWKRPRNILQTSLQLKDPEKAYDKTNYTFNYLKYNNNASQIYRTFGRELDLKGNTMTVTMKELSEIPN